MVIPQFLKEWCFRSTKSYSQQIVAVAVLTLLVQMGAMFGWTSPYLAKFQRNETGIYVGKDSDEASWIASFMNFGRLVGAVSGGTVLYYFGSKKAVFYSFFPITLGWILLIIGNSVIWFYVARATGGIGAGMLYSSFPLFVGEVALPSSRGAIVSLGQCGSIFANVGATLIGYYLDKEMFSLILLISCALGLLLFFWMPDSPHYLVQIGMQKSAKKSIEWYKGASEVDKQFKEVQIYIAEYNETTFFQKLADFKKPYLRKALFIVICAFMFMQICSLNSVSFYMEEVLSDAKFSLITPGLATIYINLLSAFCSIISVIMVDRFGRRILFIISGFGVSASLTALGIHFLILKDNALDPNQLSLQLLSLISVTVCCASNFVGLYCIPSTLLGELFPANIKCVSACLGSFAAGFFGFASSKTFHWLSSLLGKSNFFFMHVAFSVLTIPFALFLVPETKGKSLQEIQDDLMKRSSH